MMTTKKATKVVEMGMEVTPNQLRMIQRWLRRFKIAHVLLHEPDPPYDNLGQLKEDDKY